MRGIEVYTLTKKEDGRGWFLKILMNRDLEENKEFGEMYVTTAHPGAVKGKHYHEHSTEWFCVVKGEGQLILFDKMTNAKKKIMMGEKNMVTVRVPPGIIHGIRNVGTEMMYLIAYADRQYDSHKPDTIPYHLDF